MGFWGTRDPSIEAHEAISHPWPAGGGRGRGDRCWGGRKKSNALEDLPPHPRGRPGRSIALNRCSSIPQTRWARF